MDGPQETSRRDILQPRNSRTLAFSKEYEIFLCRGLAAPRSPVIAPVGMINQSLGHRSHSQLSPIAGRGRAQGGRRAHPNCHANEEKMLPSPSAQSCQERQTAQTEGGAGEQSSGG